MYISWPSYIRWFRHFLLLCGNHQKVCKFLTIGTDLTCYSYLHIWWLNILSDPLWILKLYSRTFWLWRIGVSYLELNLTPLSAIKVLSFTRNKHYLNDYHLNDSFLYTVKKFSDSGVTVSHDLTWTSHIDIIIRRTLVLQHLINLHCFYKTPWYAQFCCTHPLLGILVSSI